MKSKSTTLWIILITIPALAILAGVFLWPRFKKAWDEQGKPSKAAVNLSVVAEVDVAAYLLELADPEAVDDPFREAITATQQQAKTSNGTIISIFNQNINTFVAPSGRTLHYYYSNINQEGDTSNLAIIRQLSTMIDKGVTQTVEMIAKRLDRYDISKPAMKVKGSQIVMELNNVRDQEQLRELLQTRGKLEFRMVREDRNIIEVFKQIDEVLANSGSINRKQSRKTPPLQKAADTLADPNDPYAGLSDEEKGKRYVADHPFTTLFQTVYRAHSDSRGEDVTTIYAAPSGSTPNGEYNFYTSKQGVIKIKEILAQKKVRSLLPWDRIVMFSAKGESMTNSNEDSNAVYTLFVVDREVEMRGEGIASADFSYDDLTSRPCVYLEFNEEATQQWATITENNIRKRLAIVLDSAVYSAPIIQSRITTGSSMISGFSNLRDAKLVSVMLPHPLPIPVKIVQLIQKQ